MKKQPTSAHVAKAMITIPVLPTKLVSQVEAKMRSKDIKKRVKSTKYRIYAQKPVTLTLRNIHNNFAPEPDSVYINGNAMTNKNSAKFLGVVLGRHLTFRKHIDNLVEPTRPLIHTLIDLRQSQMPKSALNRFYTACVRPYYNCMSLLYD